MNDVTSGWTGKWRARDFQLGEEIGRGGMAVVHKAAHVPSGGTYAVKVVSPQTAHDREHLEREIALSLRVDSPCVIRTLGSEKNGSDVWIFMAYVEGRSLKSILLDHLTRRDHFPFLERSAYLDLFHTIALGLQAVHRAGIVHCDLKPENVLVGGDRAYLHDFGIARENFSAPEEVSGTATYMAPEQIRKEPVDQRTDIYGLGVLMFELAMGMPPFVPDDLRSVQEGLDRTRLSLLERWNLLARYVELRAHHASTTGGGSGVVKAHAESLFEQHKHARAKVPKSFPYPPLVAKTLLRCLEKDRRSRWNGATELLEQVERLRTSNLDEY